MVWQKLGTETSTVAADTITATLTGPKVFNVFLSHLLVTSNINNSYRVGQTSVDTATNYATRTNENGAESTNPNIAQTNVNVAALDELDVSYVINISGEEKLFICFGVGQNALGAAAAPRRLEAAGKWVNTSVQFDIAQCFDQGGAGDINTDSNFSVLGDLTIPPFSPDDISGLKVWLDANDLTTITKDGSDLVSLWADKSGQGNDISASGTPRPTWIDSILNSKPIIRFDGINNFMTRATFTGGAISQGLTIFFVMKHFGNAGTTRWLDSDLTDRVVISSTIGDPELTFNAGNNLQLNGGWSQTQYSIYKIIVDGASSDLFQDNVSLLAGDAGSNNMNGLSLAAELDGDFDAEVDFAEVLIYDTVLSNPDLASVMNYLSVKWAITI